jgi:hypothetical protein
VQKNLKKIYVTTPSSPNSNARKKPSNNNSSDHNSNRNMGQVLSAIRNCPCGPNIADLLEIVSERTSNKAALMAVLKGRAENESSRLVGAVEGVFVRTNSPILETILQGARTCHPGKTYIIVSKSQNGKSAAVKDLVANFLGNDAMVCTSMQESI